MLVLETDRLVVRKLTVDDAPFMLELLNEPAYIRYIGDKGVSTEDHAREYILKGPIDSYERFGFGLCLTELKNGAIPIGTCGLLKRPFLDYADIGFAFLSPFWFKGYAYEAASAVMAYGRNLLKMDHISALVSPDNERSIKLLEKLGLVFKKTITMQDDGSEAKLFITSH